MRTIPAFIITLFFFTFSALANDSTKVNEPLTWPIEIEGENGFVTTLYQPQLESFNNNIIEGRMAVTVKPPNKDVVFGAIWFKSRVSTDLENRIVVLKEIDIIKTNFPEMVEQEKVEKFKKLLSAKIESWDLVMSLDRLTASLAEVENLEKLSDNINNEAPDIYFRTKPTLLISIDGKPQSKVDDETSVEYVVNTPFFIAKDAKKGNYYINGGRFWYVSKTWEKDWVETKDVPSKYIKFSEKYRVKSDSDSIADTMEHAPDLIVVTGPAELILVDGEIDYKPINGTSLLFVSNSENDIIMDVNSQNHYLLLAGRWFYSKTLKDGDWKFCEPSKLPVDFVKIPEESEMASVRVSVPNTSEAQTALLEQSIPQTATIDRKTATVEVNYDGSPKFKKIEGTEISYIENCDKTVLMISDRYYCIEDGVWFESSRTSGPWEVSTKIPEEVNQIPPESPVYNVKYTYIYESTPEVVYVGYLPGYTNSYVYGGVVVYGTGYYYNPWYSYYYYPRPVTYGYGVHYSPYCGWGFSVGFSYGWVSWGFHPYHRSYWGGYGYRRGYRHGYRRGYRHGARNGYRTGYRAGQRNSSNRNVYNNRNGVKNTGGASSKKANSMNNKARTSNKSNNMYTDRKGNVYQGNKNGGYDNKSNNRQQSKAQKPATQPTQKTNKSLDQSRQNRSQGSQNYNRSRQNTGGNYGGGRSGGGRTGGGGRGRR